MSVPHWSAQRSPGRTPVALRRPGGTDHFTRNKVSARPMTHQSRGGHQRKEQYDMSQCSTLLSLWGNEAAAVDAYITDGRIILTVESPDGGKVSVGGYPHHLEAIRDALTAAIDEVPAVTRKWNPYDELGDLDFTDIPGVQS